MQFAHPIWLAVGLISCITLVYGFYQFQKRSGRALERFAAGHLVEKLTQSVSPGRRMIKRILLIMALASIFLALARPQAGFRWEEVKRKGIDILLAVDTSKSMLANDVKPNRLERSKMGIMDFVSRLEGDRVGLIPFAGTAFLMCPLTLDYDAFKRSLMALDTGIIPEVGTDLAAAISEAEFAFSDRANHRILVLVTDGEDLEGGALSAAKEAAAKNMTIYTVGVGTPAGELIPLDHEGKGGAFLKDDKGQMVKSRLDEKMLRQIAETTGGLYEPLGRQAEGLEAIYRQRLSLVPKQELAERMRKVPIDRFEWPLLFALLLLVVEFAMSDRKPSRRTIPVIKTANRRPVTRGRAALASLAALLILAFWVQPREAGASPQGGEKAYKKGDYALATKEYRAAADKSPEDRQLQFNLGAAAYKNKDFKEASSAFKKVLESSDLSLQNLAYYNLANTLYRQGQGTDKTDPNTTIRQWEGAIEAYGGALKLSPEDEDARFNQEFVKKKLEELKKKQKQHNNKKEQDKKHSNGKGNEKDQKNDQNKDKGKSENQDNKQAKNQDEKGDKNNKPSGSQDKAPSKNSKNQDKPGKGQDSPQQERNMGQKQEQDKKSSKPGQMSKEEAKDLLDSLKGDERAMPIFAKNNTQGKKKDERKRRDW
ncbi:MAG: VWA domain-containing protein [Pseudomonadota bacterium]